MAYVGTAAAGKTLIGAGSGQSATFASIGTNSGLTAHGVVISEGNNAFEATSAGIVGQVLMSNGAGINPSFQNGGTSIVNTLTGNSGGPISPTAGNFNILGATVASGTSPIVTAGAGSTLTINAQRSQALAAEDATKVGLSNFDSASFAVSANGFVTLLSTGFSPNSTIQLFDDFTGTTTGVATAGDACLFSNLLWRQANNAAAFGSGTNTSETGHPGLVGSAGASTSGIFLTNTPNSTAVTPQFFLGNGATVLNWVFKIASLSNGGARYTLRFGWGDTASGDQANGVYFEYSDNINSGNWNLKTAAASSRNTTNTTVAADTSWHNFKITVNAALNAAEFFMDGVSKGTIALTIPSLTVTPMFEITLGAGAPASNAVVVDLFYMTQTLTTPR